jgi:hypothetical protein
MYINDPRLRQALAHDATETARRTLKHKRLRGAER